MGESWSRARFLAAKTLAGGVLRPWSRNLRGSSTSEKRWSEWEGSELRSSVGIVMVKTLPMRQLKAGEACRGWVGA